VRSLSTGTAGVIAAALAAGVAASAGVAWRVHDSDQRATAAQQQTIARMQNEINVLTERDSVQTDWSQLAARAEPSVFTISTEAGLGSGWVVRSDASGSDLVTNFHVVAEAVATGQQTVDVVQADRTLKGTVVRTDRTDDLAVVHVRERLAPLKPATARPRLGTTVMVLGSPLGLGGSISIGLVSGFLRSDVSGSDLVTNFHVVAEAVATGEQTVDVVQADRTLKGTVVRTDRTDDLAVVHVRERLAPLKPATARPRLGTTLMVLGSPLGLGGSISIGLVSGFRSIDGSDYVQFSAPISPGNSGGPVVDSQGHVIGIASGKYVGDGVEALGFAIPVSVACAQLNVCEET